MKRNTILGYRMGRCTQGRDDFAKLTIQVYVLRQHDYAKELLGWLHNPEQMEFVRQSAHAIKHENGTTIGLKTDSRDTIDVEWQGYRYQDDSEARWIAPKLGHCYLDQPSLSLLKLLLPCFGNNGKDTQPEEFLAFLRSKGAVPIRFFNATSDFLPVENFDPAEYLNTETIHA